MDEVKGSSARVASRRWCHEHRYSTPGVPPAGLRSDSWYQVCWAASASPPRQQLLISQLLLGP